MFIEITDEERQEFIRIKELLESNNREAILLAYSLCHSYFEKFKNRLFIKNPLIRDSYRNVQDFFNLKRAQECLYFYYHVDLYIIKCILEGMDVFMKK